MNTQQNKLQYFPISFFAMVMGLSGLTIATQKMEEVTQIEHAASAVLAYVVLGIFAVILGLYTLKVLRYREAVKAEFGHPIKLHFFPAMSISLLLLSVVFLQSHPSLSFWLWSVGAIVHLVLTLKVVSMWMHHTHFELGHMNPAWFIPDVGNIIVPVAGVTHAPEQISWFFFSIGLVFWIILLIIFFNRVIFHHPLPAKFLPTLFILIAPPAIGFISYYKLSHQLDGFANVMYFFGVFILLLLTVQARLFVRIQFFLSWWAYSFPLAAITIATFLMYHLTQQACFYVLAMVLYVLLVMLIALLIIRTTRGILRKEFCTAEH